VIKIIGLIIANYALARLLDMAMHKDAHVAARIVATIALVVNMLLALALLASAGPTIPPGLR
jgi:hypothetical protein